MSAQARQDEFVLSLIDTGTFIDIGCYHPEKLNNTYLLEQHGWTGIALDVVDFSEMWQSRSTPFICADALTYDYSDLPGVVDYLSLDVEGNGDRFKALQQVIYNREFKIITIEHDIYKGYELSEAEPQRKLLSSLGYRLLCKNVMVDIRPFEDWWVNPKYLKGYERYQCYGAHCDKILNLK